MKRNCSTEFHQKKRALPGFFNFGKGENEMDKITIFIDTETISSDELLEEDEGGRV